MAIDVEAYYEKYFPMVLRRCRRMLGNGDDALDAAQDVFIKLINARLRLKADYPSSLLYVMATNTCLNRIRRAKNSGEDKTAELEECMSAGPDKAYDRVDAALLVEYILKTESESTRAICFMYHGDGMTFQQVASATGMSVSGVRKRLLTFQKRIKKQFEGAGNG